MKAQAVGYWICTVLRARHDPFGNPIALFQPSLPEARLETGK